MSKTSRNLRAFSWGKFSWTEMICVKKLTLCNSELNHYLQGCWDWLKSSSISTWQTPSPPPCRQPMVLTYVSRWAGCEWSWKVLPSWWHTWGGAFFVSLVVWSNRSSNVYSGLLQTRSRQALTGSRDFQLIKIPGFLIMKSRDFLGFAWRV